MVPVSVVIPLFNSADYIQKVLEAVLAQRYDGEVEVIVVNDGSTDRSPELIKSFEETGKIRVIHQRNHGSAAATNAGFQAATHDFICSIDSDVVVQPDFLQKVMEEFHDPRVAAVQGYYRTPRTVTVWARMMGYDVEKRYDDIPGKYVTQVCTGDTVYRKSALDMVGLFDSGFIYGYDNDMSYRLIDAGYRLVFRKDAVCDHYWKADIRSYISQQYRSAYGRMNLIYKHRSKMAGDSVSGPRMILQVPFTMLFFGLLALSIIAFPFNPLAKNVLAASLAIFFVLFVDRFLFALGIFKKQKDFSVLIMPFLHIIRNSIWCWASLRWVMKKMRLP